MASYVGASKGQEIVRCAASSNQVRMVTKIAIYDPNAASLRFVHGDGLLVSSDQICFTDSFKTGPSEMGNRQRLHLIELVKRSAMHHQILSSGNLNLLGAFKDRFKTLSAVKAALTYLSDITSAKQPCPALDRLQKDFVPRTNQTVQDQGVPCMVISSDPKWNFDTQLGFQARIPREKETEMRRIHVTFTTTYSSNITFDDFQHAAFCLAGLENAGFVLYVQEEQNDPRYFVQGLTPYVPPKLAQPMRTTAGWTVDCFVARFEKFEAFAKKYSLASYPNPIRWLEAQLEDEFRLAQMGAGHRLGQPYKGKVGDDFVTPVVGWEMLKCFVWKVQGSYPRRIAPWGKLEEPEHAKKDRREQKRKEKAARDAHATQFPGLPPINRSGHMNQLPIPIRQLPELGSRRSSAGQTTDDSEPPNLGRRKGNRGELIIEDPDEPGWDSSGFPSLRGSNVVKTPEPTKKGLQELKETLRRAQVIYGPGSESEQGDLYAISDCEDSQTGKKRARPRSPTDPPPKRFRRASDDDSLFGGREEETSFAEDRGASEKESQDTRERLTPDSPAFKYSNWLVGSPPQTRKRPARKSGTPNSLNRSETPVTAMDIPIRRL